MLFNSIAFGMFLPLVFLFYWFITQKNLKLQNLFLLTASWFFYGWWDWRFLIMLIALSLCNYFFGLAIEKNIEKKSRKSFLIAGIILNLGVLAVFKYFNFFVDSFIDMVSLFGYNLSKSTTHFILPLGISFYVFLALSYLIDINKRTITANKNVVEVLLSLSFFPIILAGPIQRPSLLLPQIGQKRTFSYERATDGIRQILWGLFTKVVIADNLSVYADDIFNNFDSYSGSTLLLGALFYAVQIYADFSGYSNIAIGTARLFGFNLMRNFAYPYFSRDITEFWKRWHISLTTWFRDYLFLPVSFAISYRIKSEKVLTIKTDLFIYIIASSLTWFLTGLWHGANYTFLLWGLIHGFFLIMYQWQKNPRKKLLKKAGLKNDNKAIVLFETMLTLMIVLISWIFFRSDSVSHAFGYISTIFSGSLISIPDFPNMKLCLITIFLTISFIVIEWLGRDSQYAIEAIGVRLPVVARWAIYYALVIVIFFFAGLGQKFIYFQF